MLKRRGYPHYFFPISVTHSFFVFPATVIFKPVILIKKKLFGDVFSGPRTREGV
jgi:hypothetical protein